jgi:hypothetical protein
MPTPTVTGFTAKAHLKNGQQGLNKTDQSTSPADITGTNLVDQMPVNVTFGSITWSGNLNLSNLTVNLKCSNPGRIEDPEEGYPEDGDPDILDPEDVTVTVGSGANTSPPVDFPTNVGTP